MTNIGLRQKSNKKKRGFATSHGLCLPRLEPRIPHPSGGVWSTFISRTTWRPCGRCLCRLGLTDSRGSHPLGLCLASPCDYNIPYPSPCVNTFLKKIKKFFSWRKSNKCSIAEQMFDCRTNVRLPAGRVLVLPNGRPARMLVSTNTLPARTLGITNIKPDPPTSPH